MTLCIYHGNCADGFGAAWAVREALGDIDFHPGVYQDPPPDVTDRDVILVDFSYKADVLFDMVRKARTVLVLDHHKTAADDLAGLPPPLDGPYDASAMREWAQQCNGPPLHALFDMERSGAGIAWDYFHQGKPRPKLIDHIEDRDLWRFNLPNTREIQAAVFSYPYDFEVWTGLMLATDLSELAIEGAAIERKHHKDIAELIHVVTRMMKIGGHVVPVANLPYTMTSDAGHLLCGEVDVDTVLGVAKYPFAGCYWDTPTGRVFSLRSREDGLDVGQIAKQYGGGGHKHASGFRVTFDQLDQFTAYTNRSNYMLTKDALEHLLATEGYTPISADDAVSQLVAIPAGSKIESLEAFQPQPNRISKNTVLLSCKSFCDYVNRFKEEDSTVYLNVDGGKFVAVLDHHGAHTPSWCDHTARFAPKYSLEWQAWSAIHKKTLSQIQLAQFIEEQLDSIESPEPNVMLQAALEFQSNENLALGSTHNLDDGSTRFTFVKDNASKDVNFPHRLRIRIPLHENEKSESLELRVRYSTTSDGVLTFKVSFVRNPEMIVRSAMLDLASQILEATDGLPQYEGAA